MTDREKLIHFLCKAKSIATEAGAFDDATYAQQLEMEADHLIANGVTFQKWIPVTERLPEELGEYLVVVSCGNYDGQTTEIDLASRCVTYMGGKFSVEWETSNDWDEGFGAEVTHWMPLPELPKEVE